MTCQTESLIQQLKEWQELADDFDKLQREQGTLPDFSHKARHLGGNQEGLFPENSCGKVRLSGRNDKE